MAVRFNASGDRLYTTANPPTASAYTICGWAVLDVDRNDYACIAAVENGLTNAGVTQNLVTDTDGTTIRVYSGSGFSTAGFVPGIGTPFFWSMVATSTSTNGVNAYCRTVSQNTFTTLTRGGNSFTPSHIFVGNDSYSEWLNGRVWNVKQWNRALSTQELLIESFYQRPMFPSSLNFWWPLNNANDTADKSGNGRNPTVGGTLTTEDGPVNLWVPRRRIILPMAVGGGATDLVTQESTHGHTADNLTLTTATTLSIADCTHAHTADALTLSTGTALVVAEASHAHTADALTLSTGTSLTVAEASHAHAADSLGLTTDSTLAVADASHGHTAENLTLVTTTGDTLVVQDAAHAHSAENVVLSDVPTLGIDDATHAHAADSLILSTDTSLSISDALHGHTADNVSFDGEEAQARTQGFVITDTAPRLWWQRKPKALEEAEAQERIERVVRVVERVARSQVEASRPIPAKERKAEVRDAIAPLVEQMPGFDWMAVYRAILIELESRKQEERALELAAAEIARIRAIEQDDEDVLLLLMSV